MVEKEDKVAKKVLFKSWEYNIIKRNNLHWWQNNLKLKLEVNLVEMDKVDKQVKGDITF